MPIKQSAKKALRQTAKRTLSNNAVKNSIKEAVKKLAREISAKKKKEAAEVLSELTQILDKAVKNNVVPKNSAARKKSRLQKIINKIS